MESKWKVLWNLSGTDGNELRERFPIYRKRPEKKTSQERMQLECIPKVKKFSD